MHEQTTAHHCPVQVEWPKPEDSPDTPVPLLTTFLSTTAPRPGRAQDGPLRHALRLRLISIREKGGVFGFGDHLEQTADFEDTLVVDFLPGDGTSGPRAWATWNSDIPGAVRDWRPQGSPLPDEEPTPGRWQGSVRFPKTARPILGDEATITLRVMGRGGSLPVVPRRSGDDTERVGGSGLGQASPERPHGRRLRWYQRLFADAFRDR